MSFQRLLRYSALIHLTRSSVASPMASLDIINIKSASILPNVATSALPTDWQKELAEEGAKTSITVAMGIETTIPVVVTNSANSTVTKKGAVMTDSAGEALITKVIYKVGEFAPVTSMSGNVVMVGSGLVTTDTKGKTTTKTPASFMALETLAAPTTFTAVKPSITASAGDYTAMMKLLESVRSQNNADPAYKSRYTKYSMQGMEA